MHPNDQEKTAFFTKWGVFVAIVMMFGLKTVPTTFQRMITEIFSDYILAFMHVFLDDFVVYGPQREHLDQLCLCLDMCLNAQLSLNPAKCAFSVSNGTLLGHIVRRDGIAMDPDKVNAFSQPRPHKLRRPSTGS